MDESPKTWTNVTSDPRLVRHLLDLYFCWEYPTFSSLSKDQFLKDFEDRRKRFCSSLLVNAILALASRFCDRPEVRALPDDPYTAGDRFFEEAQRLFWELQDHHDLTVVQALGIMSIREASCGRDVESRYYSGQSIRIAMEMGLHRAETYKDGHDDPDFWRVRLITFWGAFVLDNAWSMTTGALPHVSRLSRFPPKIKPVQEEEEKLWVPYTDDGLDLEHPCEQPGHITTVYNSFCELSDIVHEALYTVHCAARRPTGHDILHLYTRYLTWYDSLPIPLRLGSNFTPQMVFVHLYYHFAIASLFHPFIKLRIRGSEILPRRLCLQAADTIQTHLQIYSRLYSLRRTPSFVPYLVLVSSRVYLSASGSTIPGSLLSRDDRNILAALRRNVAALDDMASCHRAALVGANMVRYLAKALNIFLGIKAHDPLRAPPSTTASGGPEFFASCRPAAGQATSVMGSSGATPGDESAALDDEEPLHSALSWPAPRQTPSMVPSDSMLAEAGFEAW